MGIRSRLLQSSLGAGDSVSLLPVALGLLMKGVIAPLFADHNGQEKTVMASSLEWTIVRPTRLTDKPATGTTRALQVGQKRTLGGTTPRDDLASYMLLSKTTLSSARRSASAADSLSSDWLDDPLRA